jgi:hypothetical protein
MNHLTEEQLVVYHFGDADGAEAGSIEEHLHGCASCQADLDGIRRTLLAVDALEAPARTDGYGAEVWARIQPSLEGAAGSWWDRVMSFLVPRRLVVAGGIAVLVMAAFVAGRFLPTDRSVAPSNAAPGTTTSASTPTGTTASPSTGRSAAAPAPQQAAADRELVRERILLVAVGDHLERSQIALIELVNSPSGSTVDITGERERARDLVTENRLYRQAALTTGEPGVASVLDDLERVLVEIANSPSKMTGDEFNEVRKRIEQQGIIFKVRVFGDSVREREYRAVNAVAGIRG